MTQLSKLENYKQHMAARGIGGSTAFPPAWQLLWSMGAKVPPPPFLGFLPLALMGGGLFGVLFGLGTWLLGNRGFREMPAEEAFWVALISGAAFGLFMAGYYRRLARKHQLGSWEKFSAASPRT